MDLGSQKMWVITGQGMVTWIELVAEFTKNMVSPTVCVDTDFSYLGYLSLVKPKAYDIYVIIYNYHFLNTYGHIYWDKHQSNY